MKKYVVVMAAVAMVVVMAGGAWAANEVTVKATVADKCAAISGTATIDMGPVDGVADVLGVANKPITASNLSLKCTNGATVTLTPAGSGNLSDGAGHSIAYTLAGTYSMTGGGLGAAGTNLLAAWDLNASIAANGLDAAPAGVYQDLVTVTVTP